jgi:uncharacterized protein (TIGR02145 family)
MVKNNCFYFIFFCLFGLTTYAQKVSNITYHQEQSNIIVSYDLETKTPCKINMFVSTNGGASWQGPLTKVSGDVGTKIASGSHSITWNVLEEFEELRGDKIQFQVRAYGEIETVVIGTQEWTKKNLNVSKYRNGDVIPEVQDQYEWANLTSGAWCYYNNEPKNEAIYGKLYNWYAVNDPRGLAPEGYHVPSDPEQKTLTTYLGGISVAGRKMKSTGTSLWLSPNIGATNSSGFSGLPGGCRFDDGSFKNIVKTGYWWSSSDTSTRQGYSEESYSETSTTNAWFLMMLNSLGGAFDVEINKASGLSVRCIKD